MLSVHATALKGSRELLRILRLYCQRNGIPRKICTDGSTIFMSPETQDFFKRYSIIHRVSSVANPCSKDRGSWPLKALNGFLETMCLVQDVWTVMQSLKHCLGVKFC